MDGLVLRGIRKSFGAVTAVESLDMTVKEGSFTVLLGPSGCGKTTLLRMIAGLETPSGGEIYYAGRRIDPLPPGERNMAMVFQTPALYPHLNARENIGFPLLLRKRPRRERDIQVESVAAILEISHLLDRKPAQLSGGERQRVVLGRAMVREPAIFLLDEPLSSLDAKLREEMRRELLRLHRRLGATMLYVTHDQVDAMSMAEEIMVMHNGRLIQTGPPAVIYNRPATTFVGGFIGNPPMFFLEARFSRQNGGNVLAAGGAVLQGSALTPSLRPDGPVTIGIRPEDVGLGLPGGPNLDNSLELSATVSDVHPTGHQVVIELVGDQGGWHGRALAGWKYNQHRGGDRVLVRVGLRDLHFFDSVDGRRIAPGFQGMESDSVTQQHMLQGA